MSAVASDLDPRVRRSRLMLYDAFEELLREKGYEKISINDLAERSTLNRATFYAHFADKAELLDSWVTHRFDQLLEKRQVAFTTCDGALVCIVQAVCDFLAGSPQWNATGNSTPEARLESAVIEVLRRRFLCGFAAHSKSERFSLDLLASTLSWAIYGAASQWVRLLDRCPSDSIADTIAALLSPLIHAALPAQGQSQN